MVKEVVSMGGDASKWVDLLVWQVPETRKRWMMRVLERGRPQKGWECEYQCSGHGNGGGGCGAKLLVEKDDLFVTESHARNVTAHYLTFQCPECGVLTDIDNDDIRKIPSSVWEGVPHKEDHPLFEGTHGRCPQAGTSRGPQKGDGPDLQDHQRDANGHR